MPSLLPTPPLERLGADGRFEAVRAGAPWRRPIVLLARELCSFAWFEPAARGAAAAQAARLYARANTPFLDPGVIVRRAGSGYGVWWWDRERVDPWLAARFGEAAPQVAPETLAQPPGGGWRVVRLASGFELQLWRGRALTASAWRRAAPTEADWAAFARLQRDPPVPAPPAPPAPQTLPVAAAPSLAASGIELTPTLAAQAAAGGAAAVMALAAAFWAGQALRLGALAGTLEDQARAAAAPAAAASAGDAADLKRIAAFQALASRPNPLAGLQTALRVVRAHGVAAKALAIDGGVVSVTVPYAALDRVEAITQDLDATGAFADVRPLPQSAEGSIRIEMILRGATAPGAGVGIGAGESAE
ncbi:MAG TPA: hypothetical protein VGG29_13655 [Caulobacteraceae bacterium]|jgi:hypothetical protein